MASGSRGRRYARRALKGLGWVAAVVLVLIIGVGLALETSWLRGVARDQVLTALDEVFVGEVSVGEIASNPLRRIDLRDIRIDDADGRPAIQIAALAVDYSLAGALDNIVRVERVAIEGLDVWARVDDDGQWNLASLVRPGEDKPPEPPSGPSPWVVVVEEVAVDGRVHAPDAAVYPLELRARDASAGADAVSLEALRLGLGAVALDVGATRFEPPKGALDTRLELAVARAVVDSFVPGLPVPDSVSLELAARRESSRTPFDIQAKVETGDGQTVTADVAVAPETPAVRGTVATRAIDLESLLDIDVPSRLDTDIELDVAGATPETLAGTVSVKAGGRLLAETIRRATIDVKAEAGAFTLDVGARYAGVEADMDAVVRLEGESVAIDDARARFAVADLARAVDGRAPVAGRVTLDIEARGRPDSLEGRVKLDGSRVVVGDMQIGDVFVSGAVRRDGDRAEVSQLVVRAAGASLRADASAEGDDLRARLGRLEIAVADVARLIGFEGRAGGTVVVEGEAVVAAGVPVRGIARVEARSVRWGQLASSVDASLSARLRPGRATLELEATDAGQPFGTLTLAVDSRTPANVADGAAWAAGRERLLRSLELDWRGARLDAATLARFGVGVDASAELAADIDIGDRGESVELAVRVQDATSEFFAPATDLALDATLAGEQVTLALATETDGVGTIDLRARAKAPPRWADGAAWAGAGPAWLREAALDVALDLAGLRQVGVPEHVTGRATVEVKAGAGAKTVAGRVDVEATSTEFGGPFAVGVNLAAQPDDAVVEVSARREHLALVDARVRAAAGTRAALDGRVAAFAAASLEGEATSDLQVATLLALAGQDTNASGDLSLRVALSGSANQPVVDATLRGTSVRVEGIAVPELAFETRATPARVESKLSARGLSLEADVDLRRDDMPLSAALRADRFELGWLAPLVAGLAGTLSGSVDVSGTAVAPVASGELRLAGLELDPVGPVDALRKGEVVVEVAQRRNPGDGDLETRVDATVSVRAGKGKIDASLNGLIDGRGLRTARAKLSTDDLELRSAVTARLGTKVSAQVDRDDNGILRGGVDIGDTLVVVDSEAEAAQDLYETGALEDVVILGPDGRRLGPDGKPVDPEALEGEEEPDGPPRVVLEIRAPRTIQVYAPEGQLVVAADLEARAVPGFSLSGTVTSDDGRVELFGRRYRLDRGAVAFTGDPAMPAIDVRLSYEFPRFTMAIELSGTPADPELLLSADPAIYDEPELLSFVLGAEPGAVDDDSRSLQDQASAAAAGVLASQVQSAVKDRLPVDVLRLEMSENSTAAKVTVGKWITRRLFVAFRHNFEAELEQNTEEARIEYRLLRNLLLEGYFGDQGAAGVDLLWIKRF